VSSEQRFALDGQMAGLLSGLVARVEAYPELKASETVLMLQRSLNEVEAQIAAARRTYNAAVTEYNTAIETVPTSAVAIVFGFTRRTFFEAAEGDREVPPAAVAPR
jgi:LemA protein